MPKTFIVSDETVNSYGFRVITEGIDISQFAKNPVMLWMHRRPSGYSKDEPLPIGNWLNLIKENGQLKAEAAIDSKDDFARTINDKVDQGIIRMASIGIEVIATSMATEDMVPGQTGPTVTRSKLIEISLVDIGSNDNALALYDSSGTVIKLSKGQMPDVLKIEIDNNNLNITEMKLVALKLGLGETANENEILAKIGKLSDDNISLAADNKNLKDQLKLINDKQITELVDGAIKSEKITTDKKDFFLKMASSDLEGTKKYIESLQPVKKPAQSVIKETPEGTKNLKWDEVAKGGIKALEALKADDPEAYIFAYKEKYGIEFKEPKD